MNIINNPQPCEWAALCERNAPSDEQVMESVRAIVETVRKEGDQALRRFAHDFDCATITDIELTDDERTLLAAQTSAEVQQAIQHALHNIQAFHKAQKPMMVEVELNPVCIVCKRQYPFSVWDCIFLADVHLCSRQC